MTVVWDAIIVGAGPAGMAAALYTGRARLKTLLLDRMGAGGGQLLNTELIEDYPAIETITGAQMAEAQVAQIRKFGVEVSWGDVVKRELDGDGITHVLTTADGDRHVGKTVIVATGGQPRKLGCPGEAELAGRGVSYCAICDGAFFEDEVLAVVGGGDSAVEEATFLTRYGERVYIIHRRDEWRAAKLLQERALANPKIVPVWNSVVEEIGGTDKVDFLQVRDVTTGDAQRIDVGAVFIYVGFMPNNALFDAAFERDAQGFIVTDHMMATSVPGLYVAGDVRSQYVRQISNAVGDATTAAVAATRYLEELDGATSAQPVLSSAASG